MQPITDPRVAATFGSYPDAIRDRLLAVRELIFATAKATEGVGEIEETLKWGEPAYLTPQTRSGSTIRLGWKASLPDTYALHFICTTNLVERFRTWFPREFKYDGNRSIVFEVDDPVSTTSLSECIVAALTYHKTKRR